MSGCSGSVTRAPATYVVRADDTLYGIAWRHELDYRDLARWNGIGSDYRLRVGQVLILQAARGAAAARSHASANAPAANPSSAIGAPTNSAPAHSSPPATPPPGPRSPPPAVAAAPGLRWIWPTEHRSVPRPVPGGGILVFGQLGQEVHAAADGRVVYTGAGIRGYGNLIIIKHADNLLSSYAHNRDMLVIEGQSVTMGQPIAHMGVGPHQVSVLYFEIRSNGRPVDPLPFLPR